MLNADIVAIFVYDFLDCSAKNEGKLTLKSVNLCFFRLPDSWQISITCLLHHNIYVVAL